MTLKIGDKEITNVAIGDNPLEDIYIGDKLVWFRHFPTGYELNIPQTTTYEEVPYNQINTFTDRITHFGTSGNGFEFALSPKTLNKFPSNKAFDITYHAHNPSIKDYSLSKHISTQWLKSAADGLGREVDWTQHSELVDEIDGIQWTNTANEYLYIEPGTTTYSGVDGNLYMGIFEFDGPYVTLDDYSIEDYITIKIYDS